MLADSGYWSIAQITRLQDTDGLTVLVPPIQQTKSRDREHPKTSQMRTAVESENGRELYRHRQRIVEPVFAQIKHNRGITRLLRRGRHAVQAEIDLIATTHNLLKLYHTLGRPQTA